MRVLILTLITALLLTTSAFASHVFLEGIRIDQELSQGETARVRVEIDTQGDEDIRIRASIPELGIYRSAGPINVKLKNGRSNDFSKNLWLPTEDLPPGEYWVRVYIKTNNRKIVKHRLIIIE